MAGSDLSAVPAQAGVAIFCIFIESEIASSRLLARRRDSQSQSGHFSKVSYFVRKIVYIAIVAFKLALRGSERSN